MGAVAVLRMDRQIQGKKQGDQLGGCGNHCRGENGGGGRGEGTALEVMRSGWILETYGRRTIGVVGGLGVAGIWGWERDATCWFWSVFSQEFSAHLLSEHLRAVCVLGSSWKEFGGKAHILWAPGFFL